MSQNTFKRRDFLKFSGIAGLSSNALSPMRAVSEVLLPISTQADFYVSVDGCDENPGTSVEKPFASLKRARDAVRVHKVSFPNKSITVLIRGGRYQLNETLVFGLQDSGSERASVSYAAYPGEKPIFSSGKEIMSWNKAPLDLPDVPEQAKGKLMVAEFSGSIKTLFDEQGMLPRARTEGFIPTKNGKKTQINFPKGAMKNWPNMQDVELFVRPHHAWILNVLPLASVNVNNGVANTKLMSTYAMNKLHFLPETKNCWVENIYEGLNKPGSWLLDSKAKKVYLWPRSDAKVYSPQLQELIRIEGDINITGPSDTPVKNLHFLGLSFMHAERHTLSDKDAGIQHEWEMQDKNHAMFRLRGTENCSVSGCHFAHCGGGALRLDLHAINNSITNNLIEHVGSTGIFLCGYGPGTKDVNKHNVVSNNYIHHTGRIYSHGSGILVWQSGDNKVTNNLIHNTPYTGLIVSGYMSHFFAKGDNRELTRTVRWHELGGSRRKFTRDQAMPYLHTRNNLIAYNEIHHAMEELGDGNAIYIRGAGKNNLIKANYVHHLLAPMIMQAAIRTDGGQTDTLITENIIYKCTSQGILLKLNNRAENNIIMDIIAPPRGYYMSLREGPMTGASIKNNIFYSSTENCKFIDELPAGKGRVSEDRRGRALARAADTDANNNVYFCKANNSIAEAHLTKHKDQGIDLNSLAVDPLFVDISKGNFNLQSNSPARKLGIKSIDMSKIGLQNARA